MTELDRKKPYFLVFLGDGKTGEKEYLVESWNDYIVCHRVLPQGSFLSYMLSPLDFKLEMRNSHNLQHDSFGHHGVFKN